MAGIFFNYHFRVVLHLDIFPTCRVAQGRLALAWRDRARSPADYHAHYHQGSQGRFRHFSRYEIALRSIPGSSLSLPMAVLHLVHSIPRTFPVS